MEGRKDDRDKVRMELLPPELMDGVAFVLTQGAIKYGVRNWEKGMAWSRVYGALLRHLNAWWGGEDTDPETGSSHLWHAGCCIAFLIAYEARQAGTDDRWIADRAETVADLVDRARNMTGAEAFATAAAMPGTEELKGYRKLMEQLPHNEDRRVPRRYPGDLIEGDQ